LGSPLQTADLSIAYANNHTTRIGTCHWEQSFTVTGTYGGHLSF